MLAGSLSGYSPTIVMVALIVSFICCATFLPAPQRIPPLSHDDDCRRAGDAGNPAAGVLPVVGAAIGLGSILTPYATGPSRFTTAVVICQRRITGDWGRFWADIPRIAGDYRLTVDARGVL